MKFKFLLIVFIAASTLGCHEKQNGDKRQAKLPILGNKHIENIEIDGGIKADTVYHEVPDFAFLDQNGDTITQETFTGKVYVADFFFTTCPTICPIMKAQLLRVYDEFYSNPDVLILSHTIDPVHDSVAVLYDFAKKLGIESRKWHFVTGDKDKIYEQGMNGYMVTAGEDRTAPGGYIHSGAFILVDKDKHVRGIYDGTKPDQVNELMEDINTLLAEYEK